MSAFDASGIALANRTGNSALQRFLHYRNGSDLMAMPIGISPSAMEGGTHYDGQVIFHDHCCSCPGTWDRFCTGSRTGGRQLWNGNFGFNRAYGATIRCSTVGIGFDFLVRTGRLIGIRAQRVYRYHYRQHRRVDRSCDGNHGRYAEFNGMDCCSNLSLRSSGIRLLPDDAIASAVVALKFNILGPSAARIDGLQEQQA
jgi:hypothetical protein